ncbi:MAG: glycogen synthase GlgA [Actinobacteria bacterium]|nr:glycogen synthase GlgA [Actinomycetota bacterium]
MKVAMCSMEAVPFSKTGGLGDVVGALPAFLKKQGVECIVIMPYCKRIFEKSGNWEFSLIKKDIDISFNWGQKEVFDVLSSEVIFPGNNSVTYYFIKNDKFFDRENLYGVSEKDYEDNDRRFSFFSKSILYLLKSINYRAEVIHLNDYHCGLTPVFLRHFKRNSISNESFFGSTGSVFTIHNLAYQGIYERNILTYCELGDQYFNIDALEYYGKVNFMKGGILFSEKVTTVSPTYAKEILRPEYGYGLDGVLRTREKDLVGIINGLDYSVWNPETDRKIKSNYSVGNLGGKRDCKIHLVKKMFGLEKVSKPVLGVVSRLSEQKGIDLVVDILDVLMQEDIYLVTLGSGDERYTKMLIESEKRYTDRMRVNVKYDDELARMIYAGSDIFLMPSRYEPCGLSQLISLKYGTVPVVRDTGGLSDTVKDINNEGDITKGGTGFKFKDFAGSDFLNAISRALSFYRKKDLWERIIENGMRSDFSWENSASKYKRLYLDLRKDIKAKA